MDDDNNARLGRRAFLKTAAATAGIAATPTVVAQSTPDAAAGEPAKGGAQSSKKKVKQLPGDIVIERPGSDFMVDVIKTLDLEYISTNPGSSFRSIHESLVNYGGNRKPELLTCMHEEAAISMAPCDGKGGGKPLA